MRLIALVGMMDVIGWIRTLMVFLAGDTDNNQDGRYYDYKYEHENENLDNQLDYLLWKNVKNPSSDGRHDPVG